MEKGVFVGGLVLLYALLGDASITIQTGNYTLSPINDLPADFGPVLGDSFEGQLVVADPEDACEQLAVPPIKDDWIALISRSYHATTCSFNIKVSNAEAAGASAVLVYDSVLEPLIIMAKPAGAADPSIPAFFISQKSGTLLKKLIEAGATYALILPVTQQLWMSVLFGSLAGLLCVTFVTVTFLFLSHRQRLRRQPNQAGYRLMRDEGMSPAQLRQLPLIVYDKPINTQHVSSWWEGSNEEEKSDSDSSGSNAGGKGGGTRKTCAVCIEDYKDGEKLRVLPCQHRFHMECIDQWLSSRKPLCPICKWDAKQEFIVSAASEANPETATPSAPVPMGSRRWRWNWGRSILQHQSPASVNRSSRAPSRGPLVPLFRSTPHNFPYMHAVPIETEAEEAQDSMEAQS